MTDIHHPLTVHGGPGSTALIAIEVPGRLPEVAWVGALPDTCASEAAVADFAAGIAALHRPEFRESLAPEEASARLHRPGLSGHRIVATPHLDAGRDWSPRLAPTRVDAQPGSLSISATDDVAGLGLVTEIEAVAGGLLRIRHRLTNIGDSPYVVNHLEVAVAVDAQAQRVTEFTGRGCLEHMMQEGPINDGLWLREGHEGKPGPNPAYVQLVSRDPLTNESGSAVGVHVAWSGNSRYRLERTYTGATTLGGGEALLPGEVVLDAGVHHTTPWVYLAATDVGLDGIAARFHEFLRSSPAHPTSPRLVHLNIWEAVYFDHDPAALMNLADVAAQVGVERFVVDDGWFGARRTDKAGLGDWIVARDVYPDGLRPLADHVHGLGMEFGLWFEPESVNPDSDLFRTHPDWVLSAGGRHQSEWRHQYNLDLGRAEVRDRLFEQIDAVLSDAGVDYVKWDHNRPLDHAGTGVRGGAPGVHEQTRGFYALVDRLRVAHPRIEWESCAGGGARTDLEVMQRFSRIWASDMTDAVARLSIQRGTAQLVPLEYIGSHVCRPKNQQTGRIIPLDFRAAVALFGHFGIEWNLLEASPLERARLREWILAYRTHRDLLHSGRYHRVDEPDPNLFSQAVVASGQESFIAQSARVEESLYLGGNLRVPGLAPEGLYDVYALLPDADDPTATTISARPWRGDTLAHVGLPTGLRHPYEAITVVGNRVS